MSEWDRKELWRNRGADFLVEVSRHEEQVREKSACFDSEGPHRWAVYAYVYPKHRFFAEFDGTEKMWQDAAVQMPLHGGPSFLRKHVNADGIVTSYQVGADYHHLHDWGYTQMASKDDAYCVFSDAEALFEFLTARSGVPE